MKAKQYYKKHKSDANIGKWLKRYFEKRTCRKNIIKPEDIQDCRRRKVGDDTKLK